MMTPPTSVHAGKSEPADDHRLRIPVVQGERKRGDRNRLVGMRRVQPKDVRFDLPAGTEVEITIEPDESNLAAVYADVPMLDTQFELETAGGAVPGAARPAPRVSRATSPWPGWSTP